MSASDEPRDPGHRPRRGRRGSTTSTASATSTGCPACSPARSATVAPSWPRPRPARPSTLAYFPVWSYAHPTAVELADKIAELTPGDLNRIFFTSGGSEAVESAWKLARQYFRLTGQPDRLKVISRNIAYHGATMGALSITGLPEIKTPFEPLVPGAIKVPNTNFYRAPYFADDIEAFGRWAADAIEQAILIEGPETVAAVFLEPVQNAGGCFPPPPGYFQRVREICDRYGVLLVSDEVICAWGRLGHYFGSERYDYVPDMITMAKGLTSGYSPLGALAVSDRLVEPFLHGASFLHGITFAGHPVSAAVALANIDVFEKEGILEHVRSTRGGVQGVPRHAAGPADRGRRPGRGVLLRDRAGQGQGHPGDLRRRRVRAAAARLPVGGPLRRRSHLPGRRPGGPRGPAGPSAHLRARGVRVHDLDPAHGTHRGVEADLSAPSGEGYRRLSLWWDGLPGHIGLRDPLPGDIEVDVAVVGGGFTGLWTAYYLSEADPDLRIAVIERDVMGFGASGRNGGWCSALFPVSAERLDRAAGPGAGAAMRRAMQETVARSGGWSRQRASTAAIARGGTVVLARSAAQLGRARAEVGAARARGVGEEDLRLLSADEAAARVGATDVLGGTFTPHCAALDPARLVRGLADAGRTPRGAPLRADRGPVHRPGNRHHHPRHRAGRHGDPGHRGIHPAPWRAKRAPWCRSTR